jgi:hypothetical protein
MLAVYRVLVYDEEAGACSGIFWKNWRDWMPKGLLRNDEEDDIDPHQFAKSIAKEEDRERTATKGRP